MSHDITRYFIVSFTAFGGAASLIGCVGVFNTDGAYVNRAIFCDRLGKVISPFWRIETTNIIEVSKKDYDTFFDGYKPMFYNINITPDALAKPGTSSPSTTGA